MWTKTFPINTSNAVYMTSQIRMLSISCVPFSIALLLVFVDTETSANQMLFWLIEQFKVVYEGCKMALFMRDSHVLPWQFSSYPAPRPHLFWKFAVTSCVNRIWHSYIMLMNTIMVLYRLSMFTSWDVCNLWTLHYDTSFKVHTLIFNFQYCPQENGST